jgi:magnesium chelatase family protein
MLAIRDTKPLGDISCRIVEPSESLAPSIEQKSRIESPNPESFPTFSARKPDFSDYCGDEKLMRALVVAAAGRHNVLLFGPPGSGKTAAALRFPSLLPALTEDEALEVGVLWSLYGKFPAEGTENSSQGDSDSRDNVRIVNGVSADCALRERPAPDFPASTCSTWRYPPVRAPHHSASCEGMVGGGHPVKPGEISLAHRGLLFLDETTEFRRDVLQSLREPMEKGLVTIVRAGRTVQYPANFQLIMAANPCPCGNLGSPVKTCVCSPQEIQHYWKKLGGPLLDRIDMRIPVRAPTPEALLSCVPDRQQKLLQCVSRAIMAQGLRTQESWKSSGSPLAGPHLRNGDLSPEQVSRYCVLTHGARMLLAQEAQQLGLSARACHSVLKLGRTIGDIDGKETLDESVIEEAINYRQFGDGDMYWPF